MEREADRPRTRPSWVLRARFWILAAVTFVVTFGLISVAVVTSSTSGFPVSVVGLQLAPTRNPAGPEIEITLRNAALAPVVNLSATFSPTGRTFEVSFGSVSAADPLLTGETATAQFEVFQYGVNCGSAYPLSIDVGYSVGARINESARATMTC